MELNGKEFIRGPFCLLCSLFLLKEYEKTYESASYAPPGSRRYFPYFRIDR